MNERFCNNVGCSFRGIKVKTDAKKCIGCKKDMSKPLDELFDSIFGR